MLERYNRTGSQDMHQCQRTAPMRSSNTRPQEHYPQITPQALIFTKNKVMINTTVQD